MNELLIVTAGFGLVLLILGTALFIISRVGRFETRMHDRFDQVHQQVRESLNHTGSSVAAETGTRPDEPGAFLRPHLAKMMERLDQLEQKLDETAGWQTRAGSIGVSAESRLAAPEQNRRRLREEFEAGITRVTSYPEEMTLALTTRCNINPPCGICERNKRTQNDEFDMSPNVLVNLVPVFRHLDILYLHCGGEPTYARYFDDVLGLVDPPTKVRFNTHGITLDEPLARRLIEGRRVDCINVSLDAARAETHAKLRGPGFAKIVENIGNLQQLKKSMGRKYPTLIVNMCITREALPELPEFIDLAARLGVDGVDLFHMNPGPTFDWTASRVMPGGGEYVFDYAAQLKIDPVEHDRLLTEAYRRAKLYSLPVNFVGQGFLSKQLTDEQKIISAHMNERHQHPEKCMVPWSRAVVAEDGQVRMCYYHDELSEYIGDLSRDPFETVWNSPKAIQVRQQMLDRVFADPCLTAPTVCIFRGRV